MSVPATSVSGETYKTDEHEIRYNSCKYITVFKIEPNPQFVQILYFGNILSSCQIHTHSLIVEKTVCSII